MKKFYVYGGLVNEGRLCARLESMGYDMYSAHYTRKGLCITVWL